MNPLEAQPGLTIITPADPGYEYWNSRSANARLKGKPSCIIPASSIEALTNALQETVNANHRLVIRGGGHCLENFVSDEAVEVIIDILMIKGIKYDPEFNDIEIMAGVTLGEMHEELYNNWVSCCLRVNTLQLALAAIYRAVHSVFYAGNMAWAPIICMQWNYIG